MVGLDIRGLRGLVGMVGHEVVQVGSERRLSVSNGKRCVNEMRS